MRIRKQPRQLPACRDSFLPCDLQVEGWSNREYSEVGNGGIFFSEKAGTVGSGEQLVAGTFAPQIIQHVNSDPDATNMSRMPELAQSGQLQLGHVQFIPERTLDLNALVDKVQDQDRSDLPGSRQSGSLQPRCGGLNFVDKSHGGLVRGQSSSLSINTETTNVDQTNLSGPALHPESCTQQDEDEDEEEDEEDDNPTRHYVRRNGFRHGGDSGISIQSEENIPDEDTIASITKTNLYECDQFPDSEQNSKLCTPDTARNRHLRRSGIPFHGNEDDHHPSKEPEGSLLHSLYLQLLAAGREGISLRGLFSSFKSQTSLPRLAHNWREQVKAHLKNGPYFEEVNGRYLLCEFLVQPSKRASKRKESSESPGVQTRRKAYQKTIEAVLCESAIEFQKQQKHNDNGERSGAPSLSMPMESNESDLDMAEPKHTKPKTAPNRSSKNRKSRAGDEDSQTHRNIRFGGAIPGSLKAMQARIIAETGIQDGIRCARKDGSNDSSKWQCPMMAMEGHTLCEHHSFLNERKRARYAKARKHHGEGTAGKSQRSRQTMRVASEVPKKHHMTHDVQSPSTPRLELYKSDSDDLTGLDEVASQALLTMKSDILNVESFSQETKVYVSNLNSLEMKVDNSKIVNGETTATSDKPAPPQFARSSTGRFIAAKKTAVRIPPHSLDTDPSIGKSNVPLMRPPSIPPLPAFYGARRKTVKNRSLLSIN
ncbi:uncharacterized protein [Physcomitrium patens]|uniref:WRC domain-containing protein n=1 Tax=Physcomitrium patens TaxID=3218 RepID=A0A2K1K3B9_PHYPA|nr:uncharacterized protein LOC112286388 [Physcomitrium patens]PNR48267.1 hypothetical protein PHYPA_012742 [Physcomitrium patens]|eukprot:XP_024384010.1 uncharacterized protein LOC112286388 [Physcomitrella patens]